MGKHSVKSDSTFGYTLLEVVLFLAISSALALIAFLGLGPRLRNVRYTDATRAIQSDITQEVINAQAGQNRRPDDFCCVKNGSNKPEIKKQEAGFNTCGQVGEGGSSQDCVINGRLVELDKEKATYYAVVSLRKPAIAGAPCSDLTDEFTSIADCFSPLIVKSGEPTPITKEHKNGLSVEPILQEDFPLIYGYVQNPESNSKHYFVKTGTAVDNYVTSAAYTELTAPKQVCLVLRNRQSVLIVKPGAQPELSSERCTT